LNDPSIFSKNLVLNQSSSLSVKTDGFFMFYSLLSILETRLCFPVCILRRLYGIITEKESDPRHISLSLDAAVSKLTDAVIERSDIQKIIRLRRQNYQFWLNYFQDKKGVKVLFPELSEGICPWVFPVLIEELNWVDKLQKQGIDISYWPDLPDEVRDRKNDANYLSEHVYALPVHQFVNRKYLERVLKQQYPHA